MQLFDLVHACYTTLVTWLPQMTALPAVIHTSSKAEEAFQEALKEDIDAAATGIGQPAQVSGHCWLLSGNGGRVSLAQCGHQYCRLGTHQAACLHSSVHDEKLSATDRSCAGSR
jgi:hypothetical protein